MAEVYAPLLVLVLIVGMLALGVWIFKSGILDGVQGGINKEIWSLAPPSWPRPDAPPSESPPAGSEPAPTPAPTAGSPTPSGPDPPWCPDGSGKCSSDDTPVVPPVGYPPGCKKGEISPSAFNRKMHWDRWTTIIPVFGPLANGISLCTGGGATRDPGQDATDALSDADFSLRHATAIWQDAYVQVLKDLGPTVLRVSKDVFGPHGLMEATAEAAALPLVQAARLLIAPMFALLVCSFMLVWAV